MGRRNSVRYFGVLRPIKERDLVLALSRYMDRLFGVLTETKASALPSCAHPVAVVVWNDHDPAGEAEPLLARSR